MKRMKKLIPFFLCLVLAIGLLPLIGPNAAANEDDWEYNVTGKQACVTRYLGSDTNVTIPNTLGGYPVTSLKGTFQSNLTIISVVIPSGVTKIDDNTFYNCHALSSVTIPDGMLWIGATSFAECANLKSVTLPASVEMIDNHAFFNCSGLQSMTIPSSTTWIGDYAFSGCSAMTSVSIPDGVQYIGRNAFASCRNLKKVTIPQSLNTISNYTFTNCYALTSVTIPVGVESIGATAFTNCSALAAVYYNGTAEQWDTVSIDASNSALNKAAFYCIPEAPVLQTPKAAEGGMELNWNAVRGAAQYRVYRRDNEKGTWSGWSQVATGVKKNTWTDPNVTPGKQYKYRIKAYGVAWSEYSNAETALMTVFVPAPTLTVTAGSGKASLSWTAVSGASQYRVYRRDNEKGSWSGWSTVCSKVIGTTWDDTTVIPGKQYKYEVRAYAGGTWSDYSNPAAVKIPIAPVLTVTANTGANSLSWTAISGATQYRVYRRDNESGSWTGWSMVKRVTDGTSWDDTDIISGKSYKYQVRAYVGGAWTDYSNALTVKAK